MQRTILRNATIITMDSERRIIKCGTVAIEGSRIAAVGRRDDLRNLTGDREIDAGGRIVMPGLIDTHIHAVHWMSRGLADDVPSLREFTHGRIDPYEACLTDEAAYLSATLYCAELLRTGTTCLAEIGGYHPAAIASAFRDCGLRAVVGWAGMDYFPPGFDVPDGLPGRLSTDETIRVNEEIVRRWHQTADGRLRASYGIRREVNASDELIRRVKQCADRDGTIIQMHVGLRAWVDEVKRRTGRTTIDYLNGLGVLGPNWLFVHAVKLTDDEVDLLADYGCKVSHNVGSSLHDGYGAISCGKFPEMLDRGVTVSLGCDTVNDNNSLDMFRAMYLAATVHKEARLRGDLVTPEQALEMATIKGAEALGWADEIGSIEVGKKADLILVDSTRLNWQPMHDFSIVSNLVYSGSGYDVMMTMVDGRVLFDAGRLVNLDEERLKAEAQRESERLLARLPGRVAPRWPVES